MVLTNKTLISDMQVGDRIPCRYTATSGAVGILSELGICTAAEIPVTGTATPDGLFYFIKVDKGLLLADRVVQTSVSWDVINAAKYIQGNILTKSINTGTVVSYSTAWPGYEGTYVFSTANEWHSASGVYSGDVTIRLSAPLKITSFSFNSRNSGYIPSCELISLDNGETKIASTVSVNGSTSIYKLANPTQMQLLKIKAIGNSYFTINNLKFDISEGALPLLIRSLIGGSAYLGTDGKASLTDKSLGAWPSNNEWDTHIVKNTLDGKITAGDNNVWHWNLFSLCQDIPVNGFEQPTAPGQYGDNTKRINRGYYVVNKQAWTASNLVDTARGFRPALEYPEDSKCSNIWF